MKSQKIKILTTTKKKQRSAQKEAPLAPSNKKKVSKSRNSNGANQHKPDPRQALFYVYYFDPQSKTFANAYRSALKAGYANEYAESITSHLPTWLAESLDDFRRKAMLDIAQRNLLEEVTMDIETPILVGPEKVPQLDGNGNAITAPNIELARIKHDASKFVAERLGKEHFSLRTEQTGANGGDLIVQVASYKDADPEDFRDAESET